MAEGQISITSAEQFGTSQLAGLMRGMFASESAPASTVEETPVLETQPETVEEVVPATEVVTEEPVVTEPVVETTEATPPPEGEELPNREDPAFKDKVQARIDKLTGEKYKALEKAQELEAELSKANERLKQASEPAPVRVENSSDTFSNVYTEAEFVDKVKSAQEIKRWCIQNPDGGMIANPDGTTKFVTPEESRSWLADVDEMLTIKAPQRKAYLDQHQQAHQFARQQFPTLYQQGSEDQVTAKNLITQFPELQRLPNWPVLLGVFIEGDKVMKAREAAAKNVKNVQQPVKKPVVKAPAVTPPASQQTKKVPLGTATAKSALERYQKEGGTSNMAALIKGMGLV